jgi:hypothetical protein
VQEESQILAVEPHSLPGNSQAVPYPPSWEPVQSGNPGLESSRPRCRGVVSRTSLISSGEIGASQVGVGQHGSPKVGIRHVGGTQVDTS